MNQAHEGPLAVAHIGDLHLTRAAERNFIDLLSIVAQLEVEFGAALDFVILPGDNADNGLPSRYSQRPERAKQTQKAPRRGLTDAGARRAPQVIAATDRQRCGRACARAAGLAGSQRGHDLNNRGGRRGDEGGDEGR